MKWPDERLARLGAVAFADNPALGPVALGEEDELSLRDAQRPHVAALVPASLSLALAVAAAGQSKDPQVQFVQTAMGVTFKDGVLTLKDAAPLTVFFSDRPERLAGHVRNDLFAKLWSEGKNSFRSDPP